MLDEFLRIARALNGAGIVPTLMGSLGLEVATGRSWQPSDIDIHVRGDARGWDAPDELRLSDSETIRRVMAALGYELTDLHEHEFRRGGLSVEFGTINALYEFAGVHWAELPLRAQAGVQFRLPTPAQFLRMYEASAQDSYRAANNNSKGLQKIDFLRQLVSSP
ncbi:hypothetical protein GCM10017783_05830 [Deinococcus piscis]|uniref:Phosphoribosylanthranilate isomerase n=1 Tax=Deinococcus piscis TaxID=394230 RepID=A0ABQ3K075_9DEIO|nr:phosphoribosylanthranilate isomerase [Deinococcus piscis]GHF96764.1 hypothetical protein GCM10017783_05830 [Deinococcus piscis]